MITYIYHKDSTLWAFEGPEEPKKHYYVDEIEKYDSDFDKWKKSMSTARESELPVAHKLADVGMHWYMTEEEFIFSDENHKSTRVRLGEPVALPGWGLEKVGQKQFQSDPTQRWYTRDQGWPYNDIHNYREAYRLVRSEPEKKRKKSNTLVGDDLLKQFVNKQINLTFYSGKLWHSDKPFPVREHFHSLSFEDNQKLYLNHIKENWLSTAYEVVNPEVIPGMDEYFSGYTKPVDGDQITLPDGYGIETSARHTWKEGIEFVRLVATITLPDKPENSAHGYTELLSKEQFNSPANQNRDNAIVGFIKTGLDKIDELGFQLSNQDKAQLLNKRIENLSKVEPSESQEEMWGQVINDARWYDGSPVKHKSLLDHFKEKFTITRK